MTGPRLELLALTGIAEVGAGDDVPAMIAAAAQRDAGGLRSGDIVVVSSKVISKAEGRTAPATERAKALESETVRVVAERLTPRGLARVVESRSGVVAAAAGIDSSNVTPGTILLLPVDCDASSRHLRARLAAITGANVGVIVSDTLGRPWREGQTDVALGAAGVAVTDDLRGSVDVHGSALEVTVRAIADEIAGAADLVKGKVDGVPAALARGLAHLVTGGPLDDTPSGGAPSRDDLDRGARALARSGPGDWFRLGHVEAVRSALGAPPGTPGVDPMPAPLDDVPARLDRALQVALRGHLLSPGRVTVTRPSPSTARLKTAETGDRPSGDRPSGDSPGGDRPGSAVLELAAAAQRVVTAAWAERLVVHVTADAADGAVLDLLATERHPEGM